MNASKITVEDALGQRFPLSDCTWLCPKMDGYYGNPEAIIFPDGVTLVPLYEGEVGREIFYRLLDPEGADVETAEIEWDAAEEEAA